MAIPPVVKATKPALRATAQKSDKSDKGGKRGTGKPPKLVIDLMEPKDTPHWLSKTDAAVVSVFEKRRRDRI